ncbi:MAG: glycogen debranching protein [Acidobacteria bacterium]|nr:glycogen debranching protein [Acidobacteriota bacterium]
MIRFNENVCGDLSQALPREWLETNGLGGFASSTITGCNTRRYHGLLTAATKPPLGRIVMLSKIDETLVIGGDRYELGVNQYPGAVHPTGHRYLKDFRLDPFPTFLYQMNGVELEKRVFMVQGENTTVIEYELRSLDSDPVPECTLELVPLIAFRDYQSTSHRNDHLNSSVRRGEGFAVVQPYAGLPELYLAHSAASVETTGHWYFNFEYGVERERGLDFQEDLFNPLRVRFDIGTSPYAAVIASTGPRQAGDAPALRAAEIERRRSIESSEPSRDPLASPLTAAANQYLAARGDLQTIIAGFHWFGDWGRDTMIALPGITLATGRHEAAKSILKAFAESMSQGMLPNRFPDAGEAPEYNTVDATLWFFEAARAYLEATDDRCFARCVLYPKLKDSIEWHLRGTRYSIHADGDGLLYAGEPGVQLTWMDAKIGDWVVTPRTGKPVEIQALWYNALRIMQDLAGLAGDSSAAVFFEHLAARAHDSFARKFWNEGGNYLYDNIDADGQGDASIRPNQILAVSLPHAILDGGGAAAVVRVVEQRLLTPLGLRSLAPGDPQYRGRYEGGVFERDSAYHQGTVWPWLMGPFLTAYLKVHGGSDAARAQCRKWLEPFEAHLHEAGLGHISEIADADPPHTPRGCVAQAWSVAEILRVVKLLAR